MVVSDRQRALGVLSDRQQAEQAINELKASGFPMDNVSILAKDADKGEQISGAEISDHVGDKEINSANGIVSDTLAASLWGGILVGLGSIAIPGIGIMIAAGSAGVALAATVASTGVAAANIGALVRALSDLGIPEEDARVYSDRLLQGHYLVMVDGTQDEVRRAETIFSNQGIKDWAMYNSPSA